MYRSHLLPVFLFCFKIPLLSPHILLEMNSWWYKLTYKAGWISNLSLEGQGFSISHSQGTGLDLHLGSQTRSVLAVGYKVKEKPCKC